MKILVVSAALLLFAVLSTCFSLTSLLFQKFIIISSILIIIINILVFSLLCSLYYIVIHLDKSIVPTTYFASINRYLYKK